MEGKGDIEGLINEIGGREEKKKKRIWIVWPFYEIMVLYNDYMTLFH